MEKLFTFISVMLFFCCCSCSHHKDYDKILEYVDRIMDSDQDSIPVSIRIIEDIKNTDYNLTEANRFKIELLYAKAMNKIGTPFTSDSIMKEVVNFYDKNGSDQDRALAYYLLGCVYRDIGDAPMAINWYHTAIELTQEISMPSLCEKVHRQMAEIFYLQGLYDLEIQELEQSKRLALLNGDTTSAILDFNQKAEAYAYMDKEDSSIILNDSAVQWLKRRGQTNIAAQICGGKIEIYLKQKKYSKAKELFDTYERESGLFSNGEIKNGYETYYYYKGLYYLGVNQLDSAHFMFNKCLNFLDDPNMRVAAFHGLSLFYRKQGVADSSAKYALLAYDANDSSYQKSAALNLMQLHSLYNYGMYEKNAKIYEKKSARLQKIIFFFVIAAILITVVVIVFYRKKKRIEIAKVENMIYRYETDKSLLSKEKEELKELLNEQEILLTNADVQFKQEKVILKDKVSNLETKVKSYKKTEKELLSTIKEKEQYIEQLQNNIDRLERDMNVKEYAAKENDIQNSKTKCKFSSFLKDVKTHPVDEDWKELSNFFMVNLPKLFMAIKNYCSNTKEERICMLTRLKFAPQEVSVLVECSLSDVTKTRSKMLKRIFGISDGKASDFDKRIMVMY